jgi:1,4-dihydroxy-2-naphthoate octaprenyltransferase
MLLDSRTAGRTLIAEPTIESLRRPIKRYFVATRPPFVTITLVGCLLGIACAYVDGVPLNALTAIATVLLGLTLHAAVNVHNDYCDHLNGTDALNTARVFPFTGGSRFIQNGVLTPRATQLFAHALFAVTIVGGLTLVWWVGVGLLWIGLYGVLAGWAYSAAPLRLNSRGLGEVCVALTFALVVIGADFVQRGSLGSTPLWASIGYALLTTNILYINQFPDRDADIAAGKHHLVARLPVSQARWGYLAIVVLATLAMALPVMLGVLPGGAALGLLAIAPAALAARQLLRFAATPQALAPAIKLTIAAAHIAALATAIGLWWAGS